MTANKMDNLPKITAWIDRVNFDKVISNLLSNAFKYTFDGGEINVEIFEDEKNIKIKVRDNGIGLNEDKPERLFDRFYQGSNSRDLHLDGTGIGLNLSKAIVNMHGGEITAQNREDGKRGLHRDQRNRQHNKERRRTSYKTSYNPPRRRPHRS